MGEKTRDRLKKVALSLFATNGYDVTSMEQIAMGVGIKKSSLYAFISSKEALFWEIYEELQSQYCAYMDRLLAESESMPPHERLCYLFKQYLIYPTHLSVAEAMTVRLFWTRSIFFPPPTLRGRLLEQAIKSEADLGERYKVIFQAGMHQGLIREAPVDDVLLSYYSLRQGLYALLISFMADLSDERKLDHIDKSWQIFWMGLRG